jgi:hypothetical protein
MWMKWGIQQSPDFGSCCVGMRKGKRVIMLFLDDIQAVVRGEIGNENFD